MKPIKDFDYKLVITDIKKDKKITLDNNDLCSGKNQDVWLAKEIREKISKWFKEKRI
jgi:hypothetical protein|tara:strand:+ start:57 stop:227 length:171 start_codon:yes stop_codon:yes gene_type:complete